MIGVSYESIRCRHACGIRVSVPSRAEWGFLHSGIGILELDDLFLYILEETGVSNTIEYSTNRYDEMFPYPLEVTGVSNMNIWEMSDLKGLSFRPLSR